MKAKNSRQRRKRIECTVHLPYFLEYMVMGRFFSSEMSTEYRA